MYFEPFFHIVNRVVSGEIYTAGKNFTLPPAMTAWTNLTSAEKAAMDDNTYTTILSSWAKY